MSAIKPRVVVSNDVMGCISKLPGGAKDKALSFLMKFQLEPDSKGLNYERILAAKDKNLWSARVDQDYRAIIYKGEQEGGMSAYLLIHIAKHDDAYNWAKNRKVSVNRYTNAIALTNIEYVEKTVERDLAPRPTQPPPLFEELSDRDIVALGVPEDMIPAVRTIRSEGDLDQMSSELPVEGYEGLFMTLAGDSVSQVLSSRETRVDREVDSEDVVGAIDSPESRSRFFVVEGEDDLKRMLAAPHEQWRVFLHPTQRRLATRSVNGPSRVLGGAGTGKTVLAIHRAKYLAAGLQDTKKKVLFTTFTKNLAMDVEDSLKSICSDQEMKRIEALNLDALVYRILKAERYEHKIAFDFQGDAKSAWDEAMTDFDPSLGLTREYIREEFENVILAQGITTRDGYREASRRGRGQILARKKRDALWEIFESYRLSLSAKGFKEPDDAYRDATEIVKADEYSRPYAHAVVDETQDLSAQALIFLRALLGPQSANDLMFVGDGHQRIYDKNRAVMGKCGIDIRGRASKLYINYRTTEEIRKAAVALLEDIEVDDLDGEHDEIKRYKSLIQGVPPSIHESQDMESALEIVVSSIKSDTDNNPGFRVGVLASSRRLRDQIVHHLKSLDIKAKTIDHKEPAWNKDYSVYAATLHRAKGLEFDTVVLVNDSKLTELQRRLVYVGMTRAKVGLTTINMVGATAKR